MQRYQEFKAILDLYGYELQTSPKQFLDHPFPCIQFRCVEGHTSTLRDTSFKTKLSLSSLYSLCGTCNMYLTKYHKIHYECAKQYCRLIRYQSPVTVTYQCKCGDIKTTILKNKRVPFYVSCPCFCEDEVSIIFSNEEKLSQRVSEELLSLNMNILGADGMTYNVSELQRSFLDMYFEYMGVEDILYERTAPKIGMFRLKYKNQLVYYVPDFYIPTKKQCVFLFDNHVFQRNRSYLIRQCLTISFDHKVTLVIFTNKLSTEFDIMSFYSGNTIM